MLKIREALRQDCPAILDLIKGLALYEKAPEEVTISLQELEDAGFGKNPVWRAFVAENDTDIVGFALYYVRFSTWKGQRMYLEDLYIREEFRGQGLGKLLFDRLIQETKDKGFKGMVWQVLDWNTPAINFYKKYKASFDAEWINVSIEAGELAAITNND